MVSTREFKQLKDQYRQLMQENEELKSKLAKYKTQDTTTEQDPPIIDFFGEAEQD